MDLGCMCYQSFLICALRLHPPLPIFANVAAAFLVLIVADMQMNLTSVKVWEPWTMDDGPGCPGGPACSQVAGFHSSWAGLDFATVHGAGHMVPATRPAQALELLRRFLAGSF